MRRILTALCLIVATCSVAAATRPNVVLFIADDMGQDAGCYGNPDVRTPALDQLAREGTMLRYAFCTTASCSASRSVILSGMQNHTTGHYGHSHRAHHFSTFRSIRTLPVILDEHGYRTGRVGKYHVAPESVYRFQTAIQASAWNPVGMSEASREFIADRSTPFFLYFCTLTPHRSPGVLEHHPLKPNPFGNHQTYPEISDVIYDESSLTVPSFLPDSPECRAELAQYYQAISRTDAGLARLVEILKETGQYENTVILFAADNGMPWPGAKTTVYEPGLRLPLVVRDPGQKRKGVVSDAMISWVDFTPTILDYAGVHEVWAPPFVIGDPESDATGQTSAPELVRYSFHGRSFRPTLGGENLADWKLVYASHQFHEITMYYPTRVIRTDRHKLILNLAHPLPYPFASDLYASATWQATLKSEVPFYGKRKISDYLFRPRYELYDLQADPGELRNLADSAEHRQIFKWLAGQLKDYQRRTNDPWFTKYIYE